MFTRRGFLKAGVGSLVCAPAIGAEASTKPLIGSQLYGWGQYYQRENKALDVEEVLSALRDAGYDYAEGSNGISEASMKFAEQARAKGLKVVSQYTGGRLHDEGGEKVVERMLAGAGDFAKAGFSILVCNPDPVGRAKTDEELAAQARNLQLLGSELKKHGVKLALHHHTPEFANGAKEYHANFQKTARADVGFCYDVHWVYRGGVQPREALRDYGNRIVTWHLRQSRGGVWWENMDSGDIDYGFVNQFAKDMEIPRLYTVELALEKETKVTRNAVENHRRSLEFVRKMMA